LYSRKIIGKKNLAIFYWSVARICFITKQ